MSQYPTCTPQFPLHHFQSCRCLHLLQPGVLRQVPSVRLRSNPCLLQGSNKHTGLEKISFQKTLLSKRHTLGDNRVNRVPSISDSNRPRPGPPPRPFPASAPVRPPPPPARPRPPPPQPRVTAHCSSKSEPAARYNFRHHFSPQIWAIKQLPRNSY